MRQGLLAVLLAGLLALATAGAVIGLGLYDVSATSAHTQPVHTLLETAMRQSVKARASTIAAPSLNEPAMVARGATCYRDWCVQCHGGPGVPPSPIGMSLQPLPGPLIDAARRWQARELYWITRHGIKMSGMPAWEYRLPEDDLWAVVAFLEQLPRLSPRAYAAAMGSVAGQRCHTLQTTCTAPPCPAPDPGPGGEVEITRKGSGRAPVLLAQYACTACHIIPGVTSSHPQVGPPLDDLWRRALIAGKLPNTEESLVRWIRFPQEVDAETAMPHLGVTAEHAHEMARYLLSPP